MPTGRARTTMFLACVAVLTWAIAWPLGQVPAPAAAPAGTGLIAGQVVDVPGGRPVPEATVVLLGRPTGPGAAATPAGRGAAPGRGSASSQGPIGADAQGRFVFGSLPAGSYTIQASRPGYQIAPSSPMIELADGARELDVRIRLTKLGALSGTLRDESGDPVVGVDVIGFRRFTFNGRPSLSPTARARSNDRGAYRLSNVQPGDYFVCACGKDPIPFDGLLLTTLAAEPLQLVGVAARALTMGSDAVSLDRTLRTHAPTLHPNSQSVARATRVTVAPGEERAGIDISVELVRATRVSGRVVGASGPVQAAGIRLVPALDAESGYEFFSIPPMLVQPDGRFDFASVPPGQYRLFAAHLGSQVRSTGPSGAALSFVGSRGAAPPPPPPAPPAPGTTPTAEPILWASESITVGEDDVSGLVVALRPALKVTGRMEFAGTSPRPQSQVTARLAFIFEPMSLDRGPTGALTVARFNPDFSLNVGAGLVPGRYSIAPIGPPPYQTLESVTIAGIDVTDLPIEVGDRDIDELVITFTDSPLATLMVTVTAAMPGPRAFEDVMAIVFPAERKYWVDPFPANRRFRAVPVTSKGTATLANLPAGDYFVVTGTTSDTVGWQEQTRLDAFSRGAQRISLTDGARATVEVRR